MPRILFKILILITVFSGLLFSANFVFAANDPILEGIAKNTQLKKGKSVSGLSGQVLGVGLSLVGVVFFALMIYGGITWMLSRGNQDQAGKAMKTIIYAIIGLIIVLSSYVLVNFVFGSVKKAEAPTENGTNGGGKLAVN